MGSLRVVPDEWKPRLRAYLRETCGEDRDRLSAGDFRCDQSVHLVFEDGSFAVFNYAFAVGDETGERCMVFTEHCGYHVFPVRAGDVKILRSVPASGDRDVEQGTAVNR
jgi:hypothetical protein